MLDSAVANLESAGQKAELGDGTFYIRMQQKLSPQLLAQYRRWVVEHSKQESVLTLLDWITLEADIQMSASETIKGIDGPSSQASQSEQWNYSSAAKASHRLYLANTKGATVVVQCPVCNEEHKIWNCSKFKDMSASQRWMKAKQLMLCYRCLGSSHMGKSCPRNCVCSVDGCSESHHYMLHKPIQGKGASNPSSASAASLSAATSVPAAASGNDNASSCRESSVAPSRPRSHLADTVHSQQIESIALRTVPVIVKANGKFTRINAVLDDGSTHTYINSDLAETLGLHGEVKHISVSVLNGHVASFDSMPVEFDVSSVSSEETVHMQAETLSRVAGDFRPVNWRKRKRHFDHLAHIDFPALGQKPIVDLLIGLDYSDLHRSIQDICGEPGDPIARRTPLGWTCIGPTSLLLPVKTASRCHLAVPTDSSTDNDELTRQLMCFWEKEEIPGPAVDAQPLSRDEDAALNIVRDSLTSHGNIYQVALPWKDNKCELPNNYAMAEKRLKNTKSRLLKDEKLASAYRSAITSYEEKGYLRKVPVDNQGTQAQWLIPHFPVLRPDKSTTKVRIVFDASARFNGVSLNDHLYTGPKLQRSLVDVLLRFRRHPVAIACDVAEMYLRIRVNKEDRPFLRFLWRDLDQSKPPEIYEFARVVFGVNSSPFLAQFTTQEHASRNAELSPHASEAVTESTYMDDTLDSVETVEDGIQLYEDLSALWSTAGMYARKWLSNAPEVLQQIPTESRAKEIDLESGDLPSIKTLGLLWMAESDAFTFWLSVDSAEVTTKRQALRCVSRLFDPLGLVAPVVISGRILLQHIWLAGVDWDDSLLTELVKLFACWFEGLKHLSDVDVPRCLSLSGTIIKSQLHTFCDASQDAFGAVVYCRHEYASGEISVRLVAARARVAPLKSISIPRLELMGAIRGARLATSAAAVMW